MASSVVCSSQFCLLDLRKTLTRILKQHGRHVRLKAWMFSRAPRQSTPSRWRYAWMLNKIVCDFSKFSPRCTTCVVYYILSKNFVVFSA